MQPKRPIGIMAAVPQELAALQPHLDGSHTEELAGIRFLTGALGGVPVVAVECGIGKVNAGLIATLLADRFDCRALIFSGVAGSLDESVRVGDVVVAGKLICHDYGALIDGQTLAYQPGVPPLPGFPRDLGYGLPAALLAEIETLLEGLELPQLPISVTGGELRRPDVHVGTVLTGDQFVNCTATRHRLRAEFVALAVEMEGAAVAQIAEAFAIPAIVVRAMSDLAGADSHMDFGTFLDVAASQAALTVRALVPAVDGWQG